MPRREFLNLSLRSWGWIVFAALALGLFGGRLRLSSPSPHRLLFAHTFSTEVERGIIAQAIGEFEESHPGVRIEPSVGHVETYNTVGWRLQLQGRVQPDIYFHWLGFKAESCIANGWAADMSRYLSPGFADQFVPGTTLRRGGKVFFLPHSTDVCNLVWFNRDLFQKLNLRPPQSFEEWLQVTDAVRQAGVLPMAQGNRDLWPMGNFAAELLGQRLGPEVVNPLFTPGTRVQRKDLDGLQPLAALVDHGAFDLPGVFARGAAGQLTDVDAKVMFLGGKSAMHVVGSWFYADMTDAVNKNELKFGVDVFPVPASAGEVDAMAAVTTGYLLNPRSKNPKAAVEFLELLLSPKYQGMFARVGNLSARHDAMEFTEPPLLRRLLEVRATARAMVPPPDAGYAPEQAQVFYELVGKVLTARLNLDQATTYWESGKEALARKGL